MWRFKSCPKCGGDMLVDRDYYGRYEWCLQCGYIHDLADRPGATLVDVRQEAQASGSLASPVAIGQQ